LSRNAHPYPNLAHAHSLPHTPTHTHPHTHTHTHTHTYTHTHTHTLFTHALCADRYVPVAVLGLFNIVIFSRVWHAISSVPKPQNSGPDSWRARMRANAWKSTLLLVLLGGTWVVGLFFLTGDQTYWQYPFILLNAFQGLWIFLTHCVYDRQLRAEITLAWNHSSFKRCVVL
jgi:hypothetical protein